ncbi:hypothetical protein K431DRAFT_350135 [Polychaeton citri CBS 116435]|uniref:Uncharacterized protein n=1 Tax=Polychaeton citri CBS 116435 TaxID=1314669 RepID=A0A9P4Q1F4_9PEZI|nr:hypothetical protein K431DRAFT_350135 [Polychaeton citri CBS 116435]
MFNRSAYVMGCQAPYQMTRGQGLQLMRLSGVNMPMIYGERGRAFDLDHLEGSTRDAKKVHCELLATSPACFARCGSFVSSDRSLGCRISQFGLSVSLPATPYIPGICKAPLKVATSNSTDKCAIFLKKLSQPGLLARVSGTSGESFLMTHTSMADLMDVNVPLEPEEIPPYLYHGLWLREPTFQNRHISGHTVLGLDYSSGNDHLKLSGDHFDTARISRLSLRRGSGNDETRIMKMQAEQLLAKDQGRTHVLKYPTFNDKWLPIGYKALHPHVLFADDSRARKAPPNKGFDFVCKTAMFEIVASARKVLDIETMSGQRGGIWAISLAIDADSPTYIDRYC